MHSEDLKALLLKKEQEYNQGSFIGNDPICIPHLFSKKEDIEIAGFLSATIAWGNRKSIIKNARSIVKMMDDSPAEFVRNHTKRDLAPFKKFVHRTFNGEDCIAFIRSLKRIYVQHGGLETVFTAGVKEDDMNVRNSIIHFRKQFIKGIPQRTLKHISDPEKNSAAKRICMYLRWMVRHDSKGCDFGLWKNIKPGQLCLPLDVHTGNVARELGLLTRTQNDWKAVEEVTNALKHFDENDPVKFDFALFGMGVSGELKVKR